ncbi:MAG: SMI1/KNR4 family protein [Lachnospiraceae bacterium]|nr:SMI1/KNR4 family protein [Lachnospiraceae bacterium]
MKKVYYILTGILSVFCLLLFSLVTFTSSDDIQIAITSRILVGMSIGCLVLSALGLKRDSHIPGVILEKAGVLVAGFGVIAIVVEAFSGDDLLQGILLGTILIAAGIVLFIVGIIVVRSRSKKVKAEVTVNNVILNEWNTYKETLFAKMPSLKDSLRAGVTADAIGAAEAELGITFPDLLKQLYMTNDGDNGEMLCGTICGFHFMNLVSLRSEWRSLKNIADNPQLNYSGQYSSVPEGYIRRCYASAKWIPFCTDGSGNFIGIDLDPEVNGSAGQIINFGRDERVKAVLATDLNAFFARLAVFVNSGDFYTDEYDGEEVIMFRGKNGEECAHLTEYLMQK